jgi:hypothetical protein
VKVEQLESDLNPWTLYLYAMKSPVTRDKYQKRLGKFFDFIRLEGAKTEDKSRVFVEIARKDGKWAFNNIIRFIQFQNSRVIQKEISGATVRNYVKSIKLFCDMADLTIAWKKITRGLPRGRRYADDRIPTIEELTKLLEYPDRRIKAIVYTMASCGIRLGAWDYLRWGDIRPIEIDNKVVAAKIIVYAGEDDEYFSFISLEAFNELQNWMKYRESSAELINDNSWLMRDLWDTRVPQGRGLVTHPKKLASLGIKRLMERAIWAQHLRKKLEPGKKRHPYQANHSLRKWFKTRCEMSGMKPINIEKLMNHSCGISDNYYRITPSELLEDYLKAIDLLTINSDKLILQKQVLELKEKSKDSEYIIKAKLQDKDDEIKIIKEQIQALILAVNSMKDQNQINNFAQHLYDSRIIKSPSTD